MPFKCMTSRCNTKCENRGHWLGQKSKKILKYPFLPHTRLGVEI